MFRQNPGIVVVSRNIKSTKSLGLLNIVFIKTMKNYVSSFKHLRGSFLRLQPLQCMVVCRLFIREFHLITGLCSLKLRSLNLLFAVDLSCLVVRF
jgi:hypothetical protein